MKVLVIDDARAMRTILRGILTPQNFEVIEAANGNEGLAKLGELGPVDLVIVDYNMPEMRGDVFVKELRANPLLHSVKVMMITTEGDAEKVNELFHLGVNEYVFKPFTKEAILEKLVILGLLA